CLLFPRKVRIGADQCGCVGAYMISSDTRERALDSTEDATDAVAAVDATDIRDDVDGQRDGAVQYPAVAHAGEYAVRAPTMAVVDLEDPVATAQIMTFRQALSHDLQR